MSKRRQRLTGQQTKNLRAKSSMPRSDATVDGESRHQRIIREMKRDKAFHDRALSGSPPSPSHAKARGGINRSMANRCQNRPMAVKTPRNPDQEIPFPDAFRRVPVADQEALLAKLLQWPSRGKVWVAARFELDGTQTLDCFGSQGDLRRFCKESPGSSRTRWIFKSAEKAHRKIAALNETVMQQASLEK